ncbi:hypothetical protein J27TS8_11810 [Robertmurraya siralis]|uniref:Uncharacterized protein n=1 Tax=Robertmurraya siralis TaxID=77777 RepID=A0A920BSR2_9BACI|nr:hypothetical protein [Robertmurraya siralis]GIN61188.1 hypothetical protein J27TS8_11810 [Robertmurraya siralis]
MNMLIAIVLLLLIAALLGTLWLTRRSDEDYRGSTKKNTKNLTIIYAVVILLSLVALGLYISISH